MVLAQVGEHRSIHLKTICAFLFKCVRRDLHGDTTAIIVPHLRQACLQLHWPGCSMGGWSDFLTIIDLNRSQQTCTAPCPLHDSMSNECGSSFAVGAGNPNHLHSCRWMLIPCACQSRRSSTSVSNVHPTYLILTSRWLCDFRDNGRSSIQYGLRHKLLTI